MSSHRGSARNFSYTGDRVVGATSSLKHPARLSLVAMEPVEKDTGFDLETGPSSMPSICAASSRPSLRVIDNSVQPETNAFVERLVLIASADEPEDGLDHIYQETDRLMRQEKFAIVEEILMKVSPDSLPLVHALALVSVTRPARAVLGSARAEYVARVRRRMQRTDPMRIDVLLTKIE